MMATKALATSSKRASASAGPLNWKLSVRIWTLSGCNGNITMDQTQTFIYIKLSLALSEASVTQQFRFELIQPFMKHLRSEGYCELLIVVVCCCHIYWVLVQLCLETAHGWWHTLGWQQACEHALPFQLLKGGNLSGVLVIAAAWDMGMATSHLQLPRFSSTGWTFGTEVSWCHLSQFAIFIKKQSMKFTCSGKHNTIHGVRACTRQYAATNQTSCAWPDHDLLVLHFHITWGHKFKAPAKFP